MKSVLACNLLGLGSGLFAFLNTVMSKGAMQAAGMNEVLLLGWLPFLVSVGFLAYALWLVDVGAEFKGRNLFALGVFFNIFTLLGLLGA